MNTRSPAPKKKNGPGRPRFGRNKLVPMTVMVDPVVKARLGEEGRGWQDFVREAIGRKIRSSRARGVSRRRKSSR